MSPSVTRFGVRFGDLDADGLLAGNRCEDADLGRRERVGEVVLERGDLGHLRARGELELVAGDTRADDLADHRRLDAEVGEGLHEGVGDLAARLGRRGVVRARGAQEAALRKLVVVDRRGGVEEALVVGLGRLLGVRVGERDQGRGLGLADHVRVVGGGVDERNGCGRVCGGDQLR